MLGSLPLRRQLPHALGNRPRRAPLWLRRVTPSAVAACMLNSLSAHLLLPWRRKKRLNEFTPINALPTEDVASLSKLMVWIFPADRWRFLGLINAGGCH